MMNLNHLLIYQKIKNLFSKYDEIVLIEDVGNNNVIDIEVSGNHLFYANDLLTHNSGGGGGYSGADIDISNVSESSGITATADALVALFQLEGQREQGVINLKILKNRLGGYVGNVIKFAVNYETLKFSNFEDDGENNDELGIYSDAIDANEISISDDVDNTQSKQTNSIEDI